MRGISFIAFCIVLVSVPLDTHSTYYYTYPHYPNYPSYVKDPDPCCGRGEPPASKNFQGCQEYSVQVKSNRLIYVCNNYNVKAGVCPLETSTDSSTHYLDISGVQCTGDWDCPGDLKCCKGNTYHGSNVCKTPQRMADKDHSTPECQEYGLRVTDGKVQYTCENRTTQRGTCPTPKAPEDGSQFLDISAIQCIADRDCKPGFKCCKRNNLHDIKVCTKVQGIVDQQTMECQEYDLRTIDDKVEFFCKSYADKKGSCPMAPSAQTTNAPNITAIKCRGDWDCKPYFKCCFHNSDTFICKQAT